MNKEVLMLINGSGRSLRRGAYAATVMCLSLAAGSLAAAELTIVENGEPRAVIIIEAEAAKPTPDAPDPKRKPVAPPISKNQRAAQAIQAYIAKMSGTNLPIVEEGQPIAGNPVTRILVGHTRAAAKLNVEIPSGFDPTIRREAFEEEGYVLKTVGDSLVVAGNNDGPYLGTVYAAYALLEKLGCRWYFPGPFGEVVPRLATIAIPDLNVTSRPDFAVRGIWLSGWVPTTVVPSFRACHALRLHPRFSAGHVGAGARHGQHGDQCADLQEAGDEGLPPRRTQGLHADLAHLLRLRQALLDRGGGCRSHQARFL
jgi:hypothetical protein